MSVWSREQERFRRLQWGNWAVGNSPEEGKIRPLITEGDVFVPWHLPDGRVLDRFYHLFMAREWKELLENSSMEVVRVWENAGNHYSILRR